MLDDKHAGSSAEEFQTFPIHRTARHDSKHRRISSTECRFRVSLEDGGVVVEITARIS